MHIMRWTGIEIYYKAIDGISDSDYQPQMLLESLDEIENILGDFHKFLIDPIKEERHDLWCDVRHILKLMVEPT